MDSGNEPAVKRAGAGGITGVHERPIPDVAPWQRRVKFATCPRHISHDGGFTVSASSLEQVRGYAASDEVFVPVAVTPCALHLMPVESG